MLIYVISTSVKRQARREFASSNCKARETLQRVLSSFSVVGLDYSLRISSSRNAREKMASFEK